MDELISGITSYCIQGSLNSRNLLFEVLEAANPTSRLADAVAGGDQLPGS